MRISPWRLPGSSRPVAGRGVSLAIRLAALLAILLPAKGRALIPDHFESPPVHPVEMSSDGTRLFVTHTADHRLVVFDVTAAVPLRVAEIQVGLEPVTVRARTASEVWVVNHLSDSISIVDLPTGSVVRTLLVGDEPTDVVFAPKQARAFVCVSQPDKIVVYNTDDLEAPPREIPLSLSDPRSLALSPDGASVYVAALDAQNETTIVPQQVVLTMPGTIPSQPPMRPELPPPPATGLIVRHDGAKWTDEAGRNWNSRIPYTLLDHDVLRIDVGDLVIDREYRGVGTTLFNLAVNPVTGTIYATNQEAQNEVRFEPNVRGKFLKNRLTSIDPVTGQVQSHHLNAHINYADEAGNPAERAMSLGIPTDVVVSGDGTTIFLAAFGSRKIGVLDTAGNVLRRIVVGEGPCGLALDEGRNRLYVMTRLASSLSVVDLGNDSVVEFPLGFDPTPPVIAVGRRFLYDTELSSAHGDLACASCHVFGGLDGIAWDLGDPQGQFIRSTLPPDLAGFHPMKGPTVTQSLKGLPGTGALHWRGDRPLFADFNPAFVGLMGRARPLTPLQMALFQAFVEAMRYPPNPHRYLDGTLARSVEGGHAARGEVLFFNATFQKDLRCVDCHGLPHGTGTLIFPGEMIGGPQDMKTPHLRNLYEKTGFRREAGSTVRGFGFSHDGELGDLASFHVSSGLTFFSGGDREDVAAFLMAFPTGTPNVVGAQWTFDGTNSGRGERRLQMILSVADDGEAGAVAKGLDEAGDARGWVYAGAGTWESDRVADPPQSTSMLLAGAGPGRELTVTGVLLGTEERLGVDRDEDGYYDRDEIDAGTDPGDPASVPGYRTGTPLVVSGGAASTLWSLGPNPTSSPSRFAYTVGSEGNAQLHVYDLGGRRVRSLAPGGANPAVRHEASWDLVDESGRRVAPGVYFVRLEDAAGKSAVPVRVVVMR